MERHDSMKRAARYLLGAGTLAAAICLVSARPAAAQDCDPIEGTVPLLCGSVTDGSVGQPNLTVQVKDSGNTLLSETLTSTCDDPGSVCGEYNLPLATFIVPPHTGTNDYTICVLAVDGPKCETITIVVDDTGTSVSVNGTLQDSKRTDFVLTGDKWGVGTGTPGYWKNHPEAWPGPVTVGNVTYLNQQPAPGKITKYDAIKLMGKVSGDKTYSMFSQLISAKLNTMLANNHACIDATILSANNWMIAHPVGSGVKASSTAWSEGADAWHQMLDDYNNGKLCAPHRD